MVKFFLRIKMKKIALAFLAASKMLLADAYLCSYTTSDLNSSLFHPVIIEAIHEHLKKTYCTLVGTGGYFESSKMRYDPDIGFVYRTEIFLAESDPRPVINQLFIGIKEKVRALAVEEIMEIVKVTLNSKMGSMSDGEKKEIFRQFNKYAKAFDEEKKQRFIEDLELHVQLQKKVLEVNLENYEFDDDLSFHSLKVSLVDGNFQITASPKEKEIISTIISDLGSKSLFSLLKERSRLNKLGDQIKNVPPMDFLGVIFTNPKLKSHMKEIYKSYFKWNNIVDGVAGNMEKENKKPDFDDKVRAFAKMLGKDEKVLLEKAHRKEWDDFIHYLF